VTGLLRKTCVENLRAADASKAEVDFHSGWNGGTQDRNYARESLQADMKAQAKAAGFVKDFREHHYLGRADIYVPEAWHNALLQGLQVLLDAVLDLPYGVRETLQCIELFVRAFWQALPITTLKYGADFEKKQLDGVKEVMATDEYGIFATNVREAELDSMEKLGLKVPYLKTWAQEQASLNYAVKGSAAESDEPATKRLRLESFEVQAAVGSTVAQKRREYAAHAEAMECMRLDMQMSQERAQLAKEIAEADAAIAADNRAVQAAQTQTMARAARDLPVRQELDPGCKMPLVSGYKDVLIQPPAANHKHSVKTVGVKLFRGTTTAAVWKEWLYGGDHASVKSLLYEGKDGKLSLRGSGENHVNTKSELAKKRHLPEAIEALRDQGLPEIEAVKQVEKLTCEFGLNRIRQKFDAFLMRHQMRCPKRNVKSEEKALELVNLQDPSATVKAFDEAFERLMQVIASR